MDVFTDVTQCHGKELIIGVLLLSLGVIGCFVSHVTYCVEVVLLLLLLKVHGETSPSIEAKAGKPCGLRQMLALSHEIARLP